MRRLFQNITRTEFFLFWCIVLITSLPWSRFLLSVSIWAIVIISFFQLKPILYRHDAPPVHISNFQFSIFNFQLKTTPQYFTNFLRNPALIALTIPFFLVFISGLWSEDIDFWLKRVQLRIPFLVIPFAFANMDCFVSRNDSFVPRNDKRAVFILLEVALITICTTLIVVITNYAFHFTEINIALGEGRAMPFLKTHITFSIMAAFVLMGGIELWRERFYWKYEFEKKLIPVLTVFLFIGLHIISVRSGLVAAYICLTIKLFLLIFKEKRYVLGILSFLILMTIPIFAYKNIPSFQQRINYAIWDLGKYQEQLPETYSDAQRIISYKIGFEVVKNNPFLGVGSGDADAEIVKTYAQFYPNLKYKMPHNGWLFNAVETGLIGLSIYVFSFLFIVFYKKMYKNELFLLLNVAIFVGQTVDYMFEGTFGATFYVFFVSLFLNYYQDKNREISSQANV